jgi:hypothetical protein
LEQTLGKRGKVLVTATFPARVAPGDAADLRILTASYFPTSRIVRLKSRTDGNNFSFDRHPNGWLLELRMNPQRFGAIDKRKKAARITHTNIPCDDTSHEIEIIGSHKRLVGPVHALDARVLAPSC